MRTALGLLLAGVLACTSLYPSMVPDLAAQEACTWCKSTEESNPPDPQFPWLLVTTEDCDPQDEGPEGFACRDCRHASGGFPCPHYFVGWQAHNHCLEENECEDPSLAAVLDFIRAVQVGETATVDRALGVLGNMVSYDAATRSYTIAACRNEHLITVRVESSLRPGTGGNPLILACAAAWLVLLLPPPPLAGQPAVQVVPWEPCSSCTVTLSPVAQIGSPDDPELLTESSYLAAADSRWYLLPTQWHQTILAFRAPGVYERQLTRAGQGPGETTSIGGAAIAPDGMGFVVGVGKILVFDSTLAYEGEFPFEATGSVRLEATAEHLVAAYRSALAEASMHAVHVWDRRGNRLRSLAPLSREQAEVCRECFMPPILRSPSGTSVFVASRVFEYRIEEWSLEGQLLRVWEVEGAPHLDRTLPAGALQERPLNRITGLTLTPEGYLLVSGSRFLGPGSTESFLDAIDLAAGEVRGSLRLPDDPYPHYVGSGLVSVRRQDDAGYMEIHLFRPGVDGPHDR